MDEVSDPCAIGSRVVVTIDIKLFSYTQLGQDCAGDDMSFGFVQFAD